MKNPIEERISDQYPIAAGIVSPNPCQSNRFPKRKGKRTMSRTRIEDLPPADENLTPEELAEIEGAGRPSFRPTLEGLEDRQLMAANVTAALSPAGVLQVEGTPNDDVVAIKGIGNQIQVLSGVGASQKLVNQFDAGKVNSINTLMGGGSDQVTLTNLGKLSLDVTIKEWDAGGRHNKETTMADGDKVLEQSWQAGNKTLHFVTVDQWCPGDRRAERTLTGEDNGNGFVVTRTFAHMSQKEGDPLKGIGQIRMKFDRYGGMWDGGAWVPEVGQKLVERDGQPFNGEWKTINGESRWVVTTGSQQTTHRIEAYERFGIRGEGAGRLLSRDTTTGGVKVHGELKDGKWVVTTAGSKDFQTRTEVFDKADGTLRSRNTLYSASYVEETWGDTNVYTKNVWRVEKHGAEGSNDHIYKVVIANNPTTGNREMTVTGYHVKGYRVYNGAYEYDTEDGAVTWIYKLKKDGTIDKLVYYRAADFANSRLGTYSATWFGGDGYGMLKSGHSRNHCDNDYTFGWAEWKPWYYSAGIAWASRTSITTEIPGPETLASSASPGAL
jgi:hypothetical protein